MLRKIIATLPLVLYSLLIFYLSSQSHLPVPNLGFDWQDKVIHAGAFFMYGIFLRIFLVGALEIHSRKAHILLFFAVGCIFAASDEVHQYFVEGRSCDFYDWVADTVGLALSLAVTKRIMVVTEGKRSIFAKNKEHQ
ncbi:MAG: VanZ family protein [Candidatus Kapaibacterium sp.]